MSASVETTLYCDYLGCRDAVGTPKATVDEAREYATQRGYAYVDGKDLCEQHAALVAQPA